MSGRRKLPQPDGGVPARTRPVEPPASGKYFQDLGIRPGIAAPPRRLFNEAERGKHAGLMLRLGSLVFRAVTGLVALFRAQPVRTIGQNQMQPDEATIEPAEQLRSASLLAEGGIGAWEDATRLPTRELTDTLPGRRPPALR